MASQEWVFGSAIGGDQEQDSAHAPTTNAQARRPEQPDRAHAHRNQSDRSLTDRHHPACTLAYRQDPRGNLTDRHHSGCDLADGDHAVGFLGDIEDASPPYYTNSPRTRFHRYRRAAIQTVKRPVQPESDLKPVPLGGAVMAGIRAALPEASVRVELVLRSFGVQIDIDSDGALLPSAILTYVFPPSPHKRRS